MRKGYKAIGDYIRLVDERNKGLQVKHLLGLSISKQFIPSVANIIGTDMENYKIIRKNQFACSTMQVRRDKKMPVALLKEVDEAIISQAYPIFEVKDEQELLPEYLMMWFTRSEFDREACFNAVGGVRGSLEWEDFCEMQLPIPHPDKQREIVAEYKTIQTRIKLNLQLIQKLEETAQAIYKQWFVEFEFPDEDGKPYKSNGGEMEFNEELEQDIPKGWKFGKMGDITKIIMGQSPLGESYNKEGIGTPLVNGPMEFGDYFAQKSKWTTSLTKLSEVGDLIICVRGSTTGRFVKSDGRYCLGRGVCSFRAKQSQSFVDLLYKNNINKLLSCTTGSTFPNWDGQTLTQYPIIVPSKVEILRFETKVSAIIKYIENLSMELKITKKMKDLLLSNLATIEN
jgi:type I restriction enzyme S subunit